MEPNGSSKVIFEALCIINDCKFDKILNFEEFIKIYAYCLRKINQMIIPNHCSKLKIFYQYFSPNYVAQKFVFLDSKARSGLTELINIAIMYIKNIPSKVISKVSYFSPYMDVSHSFIQNCGKRYIAHIFWKF